MLAYPSFKDISEAISSGTVIDCLVTIQRLRRSIDICGSPDSTSKGKTTHTTTPPVKIITITKSPGNNVRLDGDIFFIEGITFLLTFSTPVNLLGVTALANRTVNTISKALDQHIANYRSHGFQVVEVFLDSKSGLIALNETEQLRGVQFTYAPRGQHVPVIGRKIREKDAEPYLVNFPVRYANSFSSLEYARVRHCSMPTRARNSLITSAMKCGPLSDLN